MFQHAVVFIFCLSGWLAHADIQLHVRPRVVVPPGSAVKLTQLIDGTELSPAGRARLGDISVGLAPALGETLELSNASIMGELHAIVETERAAGQKVHFVLPRAVVIDTGLRALSEDQVTGELLQAWQPLCGDCQLTVEGLSLPRVDHIRDWTLRLKSELPRGSFSVPVELVRENGVHVPAWISGRLVAKRKVPVLRRILGANERINGEDLNWEYRDISNSYDGIPRLDELNNKHLRQGLRAGDVLYSGMLEKEKAVHRGEVVQVKALETGWEVSLSAVAQADAAIGDLIALKNSKSNTTLEGRVTGQGEVEIR